MQRRAPGRTASALPPEIISDFHFSQSEFSSLMGNGEAGEGVEGDFYF